MKPSSIILLMLVLALAVSGCSFPLTPNEPSPSSPTVEFTAITPSQVPSPTATLAPVPRVRLSRADRLMQLGDYDAALAEYQQALNAQLSPEEREISLLGIGYLQYSKRDYLKARTTLQQLARDINPASAYAPVAHYYLARVQEEMNQPQLAVEAYQTAVNLNVQVIRDVLLEALGDACMKTAQYTRAVESYQAALELAGDANKEALSIKLGKAYAAGGDFSQAILTYKNVYDASLNDYTRAQMNLLMGRIYISIGEPEQAYARYLDSVQNFPASYDTYIGLVDLVNAGIPVNELQRGIIDYYAGQYGVAIQAINRYLQSHPEHDGTPHYFKALSYWKLSKYEDEITEWDHFIANHYTDAKYATAWLEKASTQWRYLNQYTNAAETLLDFVATSPSSPEAPAYLVEAGWVYSRVNNLDLAAQTWERVIEEYPAYEGAYEALFLSGIASYREKNYQKALQTFHRTRVLGSAPEDLARAHLWIGKTYTVLENPTAASEAWSQAAGEDPSGYYSERAAELLKGAAPLSDDAQVDLGVSLNFELNNAKTWMRSTFQIADGVDLISPAPLEQNLHYRRAQEFHAFFMHSRAQDEYEALRNELESDPANLFRLLLVLEKQGYYRPAILVSRQILDLAKLSDFYTLQAPSLFNHTRFGTFYFEAVISAANKNSLSPLLVFSVIRQESFFDPLAVSYQGARGLMQLMPATAKQVAENLGMGATYSVSDLDRPAINTRLGARYLSQWVDEFDGNVVAALAAYNGGIGNALGWYAQAEGDPDLMLEIIPLKETRTYIRMVSENFHIYRQIYERPE